MYIFLLATSSIGIALFICSIISMTTKHSDLNLEKDRQGKASKITFDNHSYVIWSDTLGCAMVHDRDCKCFNK